MANNYEPIFTPIRKENNILHENQQSRSHTQTSILNNSTKTNPQKDLLASRENPFSHPKELGQSRCV